MRGAAFASLLVLFSLTVDASEVAIDGVIAGNDAMHVVVTANGSVTAHATP